eukprot:2727326-Pyramimonas_sp.AAC.1
MRRGENGTGRWRKEDLSLNFKAPPLPLARRQDRRFSRGERRTPPALIPSLGGGWGQPPPDS